MALEPSFGDEPPAKPAADGLAIKSDLGGPASAPVAVAVVTPAAPKEKLGLEPDFGNGPAAPKEKLLPADLAPPPAAEPVPIYRRWWLWTAVAGVVAVAAVGVALGLTLGGSDAVAPSSTAGTFTVSFR